MNGCLIVNYLSLTIKLNQMSNNVYINSNGVKQLHNISHFNHSFVTPLGSRLQGQHRQSRPYSSFHQQSSDQRPPPRDINQIKNEAILKQASYKPEPKLQRSSSGYINSDVRKATENNNINQETNGVFPFQSKLGEKIRQYAQYEHNENRMSLNTNNDSKVTVRSQQKNMQSSMEIQKMMDFKEWVSSELLKVNERLNKNEQKISHIDKKLSNNERSGCFSNEQTQELNRIISLVEKAGSREDHKRTAKMIEQMRQNILELHETVNQLTIKKDSATLIQNSKDNQLERDVQTLKAQLQALVKKQSERNEISRQIKSIQDSIHQLKTNWHNRQRFQGTVVSARKCEGPTFALKLQEKVTVLAQNERSNQGEYSQKTIQNQPKMTILSQCVYYIDSEGFLLDSERFYLLNQQQEQIKLTELQLQMLRKHGLI